MPVQVDTPLQIDTAPQFNLRAEALGRTLPTATPRVLGPFFRLAALSPTTVRLFQPLATRVVPLLSRTVRTQTRRNALRIFGHTLAPAAQRAFTQAVVNSFYEFVTDVGQSSVAPIKRLLSCVERVEGEEAYRATRRSGRGAVLVTAHMGSFEVGLAALARVEQRVHVVFKRDASGAFEAMRARMRRTIGVLESPIDDGLATWISLRDALQNGDVVVMQADRAMPGQRSAVVSFLHGHLRIPTGAVRLARLTNTPIIPVFTVRSSRGRFVVHLLPAIEPNHPGAAADSHDPAVIAVAKAIETMVAKHPAQWLMLGPAFEEDAAHA